MTVRKIKIISLVITVLVFCSSCLGFFGSLGEKIIYDEQIILTNDGKGLPSDESGFYEVDFTKADYLTDVSGINSYADGCPTISKNGVNPAVLVVPVEYPDLTAEKKGYDIDTINKIFNGKDGETYFPSVKDYYYNSSYGQLDLNITVLDEWVTLANKSVYYEKKKNGRFGFGGDFIGDWVAIDEVMTYLEDKLDLSSFDSDGNGYIDALVIVGTNEISYDSNLGWAYRYWNGYTKQAGKLEQYDGVWVNDYAWLPFAFSYEKERANGSISYSPTAEINTKTFIHEFGHVLGAEDYYDTEYIKDPMNGFDMMDEKFNDHNPFTKMHLGWIQKSKLVVTSEPITLELKPFSETGDTVIIARNWLESLGLYQEYFVICYYAQNKESEFYLPSEMIEKPCVIVYHVNASILKSKKGTEVFYELAYNNTAYTDENGYGTENNLLECVAWDKKPFYAKFGTVAPLTLSDGSILNATINIVNVAKESATLLIDL